MSSSIELINPKAESVRRAAALQVRIDPLSISLFALNELLQVNTNGAMGLANVVKGNLGMPLLPFFSLSTLTRNLKQRPTRNTQDARRRRRPDQND